MASESLCCAYNLVMNIKTEEVALLTEFLHNHPRVLVLTGAGISQDSGIPTYRDNTGKWLSRRPILEQKFLTDSHTRQRYWVRSYYGWPLMRDAKPNASHVALAEMERRGQIELLITQNVDRLHRQAGSKNVVDLHGRVDQVRCLSCGTISTRSDLQTRLSEENNLPEQILQSPRPDGDMEVPESLITALTVPRCKSCDGNLIPNVVFFGGSVPRETVARCMNALEDADALLVLGSSLSVLSGFRFCRQAHKLDKPLAIVNPGSTRADDLAKLRLYSNAGPLLKKVIC
jgi:NAD-dependent SIR2 family protein deacetylase